MPDPNPRPSKWTRKSSRNPVKILEGVHRFEHWYRDNQIYFLSARCANQFHAFASEQAKSVFWNKFEQYTDQFEFTPWVTSLMDNHYHTIGYNTYAKNLGEMMRRLHGSVAKMVNDLLEVRLRPFWRGDDGHDYFDGCLRDRVQGERTYRYVLWQSVRHGICKDWRDYPHTRVRVGMEEAIQEALKMNAFLTGVPYKRYESRTGPPL